MTKIEQHCPDHSGSRQDCGFYKEAFGLKEIGAARMARCSSQMGTSTWPS